MVSDASSHLNVWKLKSDYGVRPSLCDKTLCIFFQSMLLVQFSLPSYTLMTEIIIRKQLFATPIKFLSLESLMGDVD